MTKYNRPDERYPESWNRLRYVIFKRDHYICQMCGKKLDKSNEMRKPVCHHIIPIKCGGSHHFDNLLTLCPRCHYLVHKEYIKKKNDELI